ncbi:MAG TPA: dTMP kinase [Candidatus Paceibacterota bacterium]|nr:dTMP kinase [Candidatus Paceibacterota bacterium]
MLIALSGIDGCGKTVQVNLLEQWLKDKGKSTLVVKAYDDISKLILRQFMEKWTDDAAIMFLFQALHAQQYSVALNALSEGQVVIADRWDESYLAYHRNFGFLSKQYDVYSMLNSLAFHDKIPDAGFIIKVPPEIARRRRESRGKPERFEDRPDNYYDLVQDTYCEIAADREWKVLDGTKTPQEIHEEICAALLGRI